MDKILLSRFESLLCERIGLNPGTLGSSTLERILTRIEEDSGISLDTFFELCGDSTELFQQLIKRIVVPESWFFRDRPVFVELTSIVLKRLSEGASKVRILSAPCAQGEEPYSVAMSLLAAGFTASQFEVVGIDISADVLASAVQGRYGNNAFRSELTECERRFFVMEENDLLVIESVKSFVTFRQHNLVQPLSDELGSFDIILCRNVLIYLTPTVQQNVLFNLTSRLNINGVLILTPAESSLMKDSRLSLTKGERREFFSFLPQSVEPFTKTNFRTVKRASDLIVKTADYSAQKMAERSVRRVIPQTIIKSPSTSPPSPSPSPSLDGAEQRANEGKFSEAQKLLIEYLRLNPYDIHGQFLMGVVTDAAGDQLAAREQYRRVLYLNPKHFEALSHLALLEQRLGNQRQAQLLTTRARRLFVSEETADE